MATQIIARHTCDRCGTVVELADDVRRPIARPEGWATFRGRLLCGTCEDALRRFVEANEAVEQSR